MVYAELTHSNCHHQYWFSYPPNLASIYLFISLHCTIRQTFVYSLSSLFCHYGCLCGHEAGFQLFDYFLHCVMGMTKRASLHSSSHCMYLPVVMSFPICASSNFYQRFTNHFAISHTLYLPCRVDVLRSQTFYVLNRNTSVLELRENFPIYPAIFACICIYLSICSSYARSYLYKYNANLSSLNNWNERINERLRHATA